MAGAWFELVVEVVEGDVEGCFVAIEEVGPEMVVDVAVVEG